MLKLKLLARLIQAARQGVPTTRNSGYPVCGIVAVNSSCSCHSRHALRSPRRADLRGLDVGRWPSRPAPTGSSAAMARPFLRRVPGGVVGSTTMAAAWRRLRPRRFAPFVASAAPGSSTSAGGGVAVQHVAHPHLILWDALHAQGGAQVHHVHSDQGQAWLRGRGFRLGLLSARRHEHRHRVALA